MFIYNCKSAVSWERSLTLLICNWIPKILHLHIYTLVSKKLNQTSDDKDIGDVIIFWPWPFIWPWTTLFTVSSTNESFSKESISRQMWTYFSCSFRIYILLILQVVLFLSSFSDHKLFYDLEQHCSPLALQMHLWAGNPCYVRCGHISRVVVEYTYMY